MRRLALGGVCAVLGAALATTPATLRGQGCPNGRSPVTEVGSRFQLAQKTLNATTNNPFLLVHESPTDPVRYVRARVSARTLGSGRWYLTVRDLLGHPIQTFSRSDFSATADRWTSRIPGSVVTLDLAPAGGTTPELEVTEYVAMPQKASNPYYSVKRPGQEDFHPLYTTHNDVDARYRPWGDVVGFVMGSWGTRLWGCSGVVAGPNLLLTAWHCGGAGGDRMLDVAFWNPDICRDLLVDLAWDDDLSSRDYGCVRVVEKDKDLDFALLEIAPIAQTGEARPVTLNVKPLRPNDPLVVIHHPLYMQKQVTMHCGVASVSVPGWTRVRDVDFAHDCDTEGGSSGAPVFNGAGEVVGLHHYGHDINPATCVEDRNSSNKAVRIARIVEFLERNRARNGNVIDKLSIVR